MAVTVRRRVGLACDPCAARHSRGSSVVTVEQGGVANALCRTHAAMLLGEARLAKLLARPAKRPTTKLPPVVDADTRRFKAAQDDR